MITRNVADREPEMPQLARGRDDRVCVQHAIQQRNGIVQPHRGIDQQCLFEAEGLSLFVEPGHVGGVEAAQAVDPNAIEVELIKLAGLRINGNLAAGVPLAPGEQDDFPQLVPKLSDPAVAGMIIGSPVYFGNMMVHAGDADGLIAGLTISYPDTIRPALQVHRTLPGVTKAAGIYLLLFEDRMLFIADTTVNQDPTADELAEISWMAAQVARNYFEVEPRVAMLSYSNFGSNPDERSNKVREAVRIAADRWPDLVIEGEMQADTAVEPSLARENFPLSKIHGDANILVCPDLESANIAYKLLWRLGKVEAIGPILTGIGAPVHVLQRGVGVDDIVNMAALCVRKAQRYGN